MELSPSLSSWTLDHEREFFRRIGLILEEQFLRGRHADYRGAIYDLARQMLADAGSPSGEDGSPEPDDFADELSDAANNGIVGDGIWDCHKGHVISMSWTRSPVGYMGSLDVLDFGTGKIFLVEPPDEDRGSTWEVVDVVDPEDHEAITRVATAFLARGWLPDNLYLSRYVSRLHVRAAYEAVFNSQGRQGWRGLQERLEEQEGSRLPVESDAERSTLLDTWLDSIIRS